ncbi:hypothetical protein [Kitasatospora griseola]|uniref:hypothetical protein n=1 Tax=Kitasatospora griseola TaxID=2064 RepID=UPI003654D8A5
MNDTHPEDNKPAGCQPWDNIKASSTPSPLEGAVEQALHDMELLETKTLGDSTTYLRVARPGTDAMELWVERHGGYEVLMTDAGGRPRDAYRPLTGPDAPENLAGQLAAEEDQAREDQAFEAQRAQAAAEDEARRLDDDLAEGRITSEQHHALVASLQPVSDVAPGQAAYESQVLAGYEAELADAGLSAAPLAEHDVEPPGIGPDDDFGLDL